MSRAPLALHQATPVELRERLAAEREGAPFLLLRDGDGSQRIVGMPPDRDRLVLGRSTDCDVALDWDGKVSRLHAELERVGAEWVLADDGLSSNGTFLAGERVRGRRRLRDGDVLVLGRTSIVFRHPAAADAETTRLTGEHDIAERVTPAQRRVLIALCRPYKDQAERTMPAGNAQIAAELHLSVAGVKTHLRALSRAFGIEALPAQEKRVRLATIAFASGIVSDRDL
jgi:pSer/pThr/pTyr-binding forkhead associated (FHA) protein